MGFVRGGIDQQLHRRGPVGHGQHRCAWTQVGQQALPHRRQGGLLQPIGPADQHQIGHGQLILKQLLKGHQVIKAGIGAALGLHRLPITHHVALGQGLAIHHRHHGVHPALAANLGPPKGRHQGFRQR